VGDVLDVYVLMQAQLTKTAIVAGLVRAVPGVSGTEIVTGPYDVVARAQAHDMDELATTVAQIQALPGVSRTATCIVIQPSRRQPISSGQTRWRRRRRRWAAHGSLAKLGRGRVNVPVTADVAHVNSTARNYWDQPSELAYVGAAVGKKRQDDPAHRWYRLPSLESFKAGCSCGWMSPERDTFDEMSRDVDRHLDAVR
jgi:AsnC-like helix-turn-helix protein